MAPLPISGLRKLMGALPSSSGSPGGGQPSQRGLGSSNPGLAVVLKPEAFRRFEPEPGWLFVMARCCRAGLREALFTINFNEFSFAFSVESLWKRKITIHEHPVSDAGNDCLIWPLGNSASRFSTSLDCQILGKAAVCGACRGVAAEPPSVLTADYRKPQPHF